MPAYRYEFKHGKSGTITTPDKFADIEEEKRLMRLNSPHYVLVKFEDLNKLAK